MKKILIAAMVMCLALPMWGQSKTVNLKKDAKKIQKKEVSKKDVTPDGEKVKLYDENIDAMEQIDRALDQARESGRFVICQVGGNWCPWCLRFAPISKRRRATATRKCWISSRTGPARPSRS